ncbi:MAG: 2-amino-4-hydroxy-6-hydroxymethyldihydropteridine diphosphokinase [Methylococcaceae bacterium]
MSPESPDTFIVYIGLGGNLADPVHSIQSARGILAAEKNIRELAFSSLYRSSPMGSADQPDYINAVMSIATTLDPLSLLDTLQRIELDHGRVRQGEQWGPRTLDLDMLLYGDILMEEPRLKLPHPGVTLREFVLYPLSEIAPPDLMIPGKGYLRTWVEQCPRRGLTVLNNV